jgi:hypothetical protein
MKIIFDSICESFKMNLKLCSSVRMQDKSSRNLRGKSRLPGTQAAFYATTRNGVVSCRLGGGGGGG